MEVTREEIEHVYELIELLKERIEFLEGKNNYKSKKHIYKTKSERAKITKFIKDYGKRNNCDIQVLWREIYQEFSDEYKVDVYELPAIREEGVSPLQAIFLHGSGNLFEKFVCKYLGIDNDEGDTNIKILKIKK